MQIKKVLTPKSLVIFFLLFYLILGLFIAQDYGIGIDEIPEARRANVAMRRYSFKDPGDPVEEYLALGIDQYYGTPQMSLFLTVENTFRPLLNTPTDYLLHYMYFVSFVVGIYAFFVLARRWMNEWAALAASLLFGFQPLFFGHGFINSKDIPNLTVFLLTISTGFWMADRLEQVAPPENFNTLVDSIRQGWQTFQGKRKKLFRGMIYFWGSLILIWAFKLQNPLVSKVITTAYNAPKTNWLGQIFRIYAPNANTVPLADYIQRAQEISSTALGLLIFLLPLLGFGALVLYALQPHKSLWQDIVLFHIRQFQAKNRGYWIPVLIAGSIWGLAVSIRVTNLTAFGIVVGYLFVKLGKRSILPLITYTLAAALVCFITWPYLWYFGLQGFIDSLSVFSNYPREGGLVWLRGVIQIKDIPPNYLLHTMAIQFTEPLIFLAVMGIIVSIILAFRKKFPVLDLILLLCWFFLPILYAAIAHPTLYNNFRQFIFITPPLFFFSGVLMGWTGRHIKSKIILGLLLVMILSPGMIGIMQLHPYQYVYYNQFVGGTEGAAGLYEMDYWFTAYKEVVQYLNENAPANSKVMVYGNYKIADHYARPDLQLSSVPFDTTPEELAKFDYVMMTTNRRGELESLNMDLYKTIYEAKAGNTTMAFIKNTTP